MNVVRSCVGSFPVGDYGPDVSVSSFTLAITTTVEQHGAGTYVTLNIRLHNLLYGSKRRLHNWLVCAGLSDFLVSGWIVTNTYIEHGRRDGDRFLATLSNQGFSFLCRATWLTPVHLHVQSSETPVLRTHASSLPDELLIRIFSQLQDCARYTAAARLMSVALVSRRWLPAATQALYSTLHFDIFSMKRCLRLAQTMSNVPHLRQLVRTLHIYISSGADAPTVERLLGWTALVPPEPGFHFLKFTLHSDHPFATVLIARVPAIRAVREMVLYGATTESLVAIPHRLERLTLEIETAPLPLPPLAYLRSLKITASHVVFEHALRNLRTLELQHTDLTVLVEVLDSLHDPLLAPNLYTLSITGCNVNMATETAPIQRLPPSIRVLRVDFPLAALINLDRAHHDLAVVEELRLDLNYHPHGKLSPTDLQLVRSLISECGSLELVTFEGGDWRTWRSSGGRFMPDEESEGKNQESAMRYLASSGVRVEFFRPDYA